MKLVVFSDAHLGFGYGTELFDDPFNALNEIIDQNKDADGFIIAGDLFDSRTPKQEVFARAMRI